MPIAADDPRLTHAYEAAATRYTDVPFQRAGSSGVARTLAELRS